MLQEIDRSEGLNGTLYLGEKGYKVINDKITDEDKKELKDMFEQKRQKFGKFKLKMIAIPSWIANYNLARILPKKDWDNIRYSVHEKYKNKCAICETEGRLDCHEIWRHDDDNLIQYLQECIVLCRLCHYSVHPTMTLFTYNEGKIDIKNVIEHFTKINECDNATYEEYKKYIFDLETYRSFVCTDHKTKAWKIDYGEYNDLVTRRCGDVNDKIRKKTVFNINNIKIDKFGKFVDNDTADEHAGWK